MSAARAWVVLPWGLVAASCSFLGLFEGSTVDEPCRSDADCQGGPYVLDECVDLVCGEDALCHGLLVDADGDGFASTDCADRPGEFSGLPEDCRDDEAEYTEPGQDVEVCDGVDNDCDGAVDEGEAAESCLGMACAAGACATAPIVELAAGCDFTCARRGNGDVECWGARDVSASDGIEDFPLGDAGFADSDPKPVVVPRVHGAIDLGAGWHHACAALQDGRVVCWGRDREKQLGARFPDFVDTQRPRPVLGLDDVIQVVAGHAHTCIRHATGQVSCWGSSANGQLGHGVVGDAHAEPVEVVDLAGATDLAAGGGQREDLTVGNDFPEGQHTCAIAEGIVSCWGWNGHGQLGTFTDAEDHPLPLSTVPVPVELPGPAVLVAANAFHSCAVLEGSGEVACWGSRVDNQQPEDSFTWVPPALVPGVEGVTKLAAGLLHTCAITAEAGLMCWGFDSDGQLGNGEAGTLGPMVAVPVDLDDVVDVAAGCRHTCAVDASGAVFCWGDDSLDQLGNTSDVPVDAPAPANLVD